MRQKAIQLVSLMTLLNIIFAFAMISPVPVKAEDYSKFNTNKLWPFSDSVTDWNKTTELHHSFKINSSPHQVDYDGAIYDNVDVGTGSRSSLVFLKMTKSNYFSVTGDYYLGFIATNMINHRMYRKANTEAEKSANGAITVSSIVFLPADPGGSDLQKEYLGYMNSNPSFAGAYVDNYEWLQDFFTPTTYNVELKDNGATAPTITLSGSTDKGRPTLTFKLTFVGGWSGALSAENNNFYFTFDPSLTADSKAKETFVTLAMKIGQNGEGFIVEKNDNQLLDSAFYTGAFGTSLKVAVNKTEWWKTIANKVYNGAYVSGSAATFTTCGKVTQYDGGKGKADPEYDESVVPDRQCINTSTGGYLDKWGVKFVKASLTNPTGATDVCTVPGYNIGAYIKEAFCNLGIMIQNFANTLMDSAISLLEEVIGA